MSKLKFVLRSHDAVEGKIRPALAQSKLNSLRVVSACGWIIIRKLSKFLTEYTRKFFRHWFSVRRNAFCVDLALTQPAQANYKKISKNA